MPALFNCAFCNLNFFKNKWNVAGLFVLIIGNSYLGLAIGIVPSVLFIIYGYISTKRVLDPESRAKEPEKYEYTSRGTFIIFNKKLNLCKKLL